MKKRILIYFKEHPLRFAFLVLNLFLFILGEIFIFQASRWDSVLTSQHAAERWAGDSEISFSQFTCLIPKSEQISVSDVYALRLALIGKLEEASLDTSLNSGLWTDAWSTDSTVTVSSDLGNGKVELIAVGENFFQFHPLTLLSGNLLSPDDFSPDRVVLDEETAWLLFGSSDVQGMSLTIDEKPFVVAGVVAKDDDFASNSTGRSDMQIFMPYDTWAALHADEEDAESVGITCYELILADPVKNFAYNALTEKFPVEDALIIQNTGRFSFSSLFNVLKAYGTRSMQTAPVAFPDWENAARSVEDWASLALFGGLVLLFLPGICILVTVISVLVFSYRKLDREILPESRERLDDAVRARQRVRLERMNREQNDSGQTGSAASSEQKNN